MARPSPSATSSPITLTRSMGRPYSVRGELDASMTQP